MANRQTKLTTMLSRCALAAALSLSTVTLTALAPQPAAAASAVSVVVNGMPITTFQIRQRANFLKLRRVGGNTTQKATDELIDEALKKQEIQRQRVSIPDEAVNAAYANFASSNKLTEAQLAQVLNRSGFPPAAFKDYIRVQMAWGQALQKRVRSQERLSEQDVVQRMLAQGGKKPSTTEYTLQQVIFVVPAAQRSARLGARKREAEAMRARFQNCQNTYTIAQGLRDVTVRDLGRVMQPALPTLWKDDIAKLDAGRTTPAKETERGIEFIAVCNARTVSDDMVAGLVFQARDMEALNKSETGPDAEVLKELKEKARIVRK